VAHFGDFLRHTNCVRALDHRLYRGWVPLWVTIPVNAAVTFWMFTVVHDASHHAISSKRWVNGLFGRLGWFFVVPKGDTDAIDDGCGSGTNGVRELVHQVGCKVFRKLNWRRR
jgi:hypothetical protein